jgi:hypothetical protein
VDHHWRFTSDTTFATNFAPRCRHASAWAQSFRVFLSFSKPLQSRLATAIGSVPFSTQSAAVHVDANVGRKSAAEARPTKKLGGLANRPSGGKSQQNSSRGRQTYVRCGPAIFLERTQRGSKELLRRAHCASRRGTRQSKVALPAFRVCLRCDLTRSRNGEPDLDRSKRRNRFAINPLKMGSRLGRTPPIAISVNWGRSPDTKPLRN